MGSFNKCLQVAEMAHFSGRSWCHLKLCVFACRDGARLPAALALCVRETQRHLGGDQSPGGPAWRTALWKRLAVLQKQGLPPSPFNTLHRSEASTRPLV